MVRARLPVFLSVFIGQVVIDQWTKQLATTHLKDTPTLIYLGDIFRLQYATNEGAFLSLGASLPPGARYWLLTIGVGLLLLGLVVYALFSERIWKTKLDQWQVAAYSLIASGGFSNWVDRARFEGSVVDFMNLGLGSVRIGGFPLRTGVFNVADLAILAGIGVLFVHGWREEKRLKAQKALETKSA
jgi:signal peptidase II